MEDRMDATGRRMLIHIYKISYEDLVENTEIRRQDRVKEISSPTKKIPLQWRGHVCQRRNISASSQICVGGRRRRGRPQQQWKDAVKSGISRWNLKQEDVCDRV